MMMIQKHWTIESLSHWEWCRGHVYFHFQQSIILLHSFHEYWKLGITVHNIIWKYQRFRTRKISKWNYQSIMYRVPEIIGVYVLSIKIISKNVVIWSARTISILLKMAWVGLELRSRRREACILPLDQENGWNKYNVHQKSKLVTSKKVNTACQAFRIRELMIDACAIGSTSAFSLSPNTIRIAFPPIKTDQNYYLQNTISRKTNLNYRTSAAHSFRNLAILRENI